MSDTGNFAIEVAEARVDQERDSSVARVQSQLAGTGSGVCKDCGDPIGAARRKAMPSADRCVDCAARREIEGRR